MSLKTMILKLHLDNVIQRGGRKYDVMSSKITILKLPSTVGGGKYDIMSLKVMILKLRIDSGTQRGGGKCDVVSLKVMI